MKKFLALLSFVVIRVIGFTLRTKIDDHGDIVDQPGHEPVIIAFWHNRTALMAYFYERLCHGRVALTFISRSRDGQFMTDVAAWFGIRAVRGSSSRHGTSAMLTAIRASKDDHIDIVITPDGPRGPRYQIQPGLVRLAQMTQRPIVAVTYTLKWKWELQSWDRFHVPLPFSTCHLVTSERIFVPDNTSDADLESITARITKALGGD